MTEAVFYWLLALELMVRPQSEARTQGPGARGQGPGASGRAREDERSLGTFYCECEGVGGRQQRDHFKCQAEATSS